MLRVSETQRMKRQMAEGEGRIWEQPETGCCVSEGFLANVSTNAILMPLEGQNQVGEKPTRPNRRSSSQSSNTGQVSSSSLCLKVSPELAERDWACQIQR